MFTAPGNRVPKKSEAFKLPNWLAKPSTSAAGFGQAALFQPTFSNLTEQTFLAKKPTTTTKINTNKANKPFATNLGDINYFDNLEIVSQTSPHEKSPKPDKFKLSEIGEELNSLTRQIYNPNSSGKRKQAEMAEKIEILEDEKLQLDKENDALSAENAKLQVDLSFHKSKIDSLSSELEKVVKIQSSNQAQLDSLNESLTEFAIFKRRYAIEQTNIRNRIKQKIETIVNQMQDENQKLRIANADLDEKHQSEKVALEEKVKDLEAAKENLSSSVADLKVKIQTEKVAFEEKVKELENAKQKLASTTAELEEKFNNEKVAFEEKIQELETSNQKLTFTTAELKEKFNNEQIAFEKKIQDLDVANQKLSSTIADLEEHNRFEKAVFDEKVEELEKQKLVQTTTTTSNVPKSPVKGILKSPSKNEVVKTSTSNLTETQALNPTSPRKRKLLGGNDIAQKNVRFDEKLPRYASKSESQSTGKGIDMSFLKKSVIIGETKRTTAAAGARASDKNPDSTYDSQDELESFLDFGD